MAKKTKRLAPTLPRGFVDRDAVEITALEQMFHRIRSVYERYGFDPVETPLFEYTESLGKFLPDTDRPNAGVFSLQDDDEKWMSLRYDLTAPLARYFAQNYDALPKPYRSYRQGYVFRNEKPGPGRFRQFMQFDADSVGAPDPAADAEMCMMMADVMDELGLGGKFIIRVNNRKVLDGVLAAAGLAEEPEKALTVLRAIDKMDRLGEEGVKLLLGAGRKDESGDFTEGAGLDNAQIDRILAYVMADADADKMFEVLAAQVEGSETGAAGVAELKEMQALFDAAGYPRDKVKIDPSVVRGLEYYTGPVFEAELTFPVTNEKGQTVVFGSVGGGGRYDGLVSRFRPEPVPATGFSIGVSRLAHALQLVGELDVTEKQGPVVVLIMDKDQIASYQAMVADLRKAGIRAELYLGASKNMAKQMKYADKRNAPAVIIEGSQEREAGEVQVKDLVAGKLASLEITDNAEWRAARPAQASVKRADLVAHIHALLEPDSADGE
ncbi:histidine--tRNA ligase [Maritalea porphyrae]|jgi:histidyl-tRNA synthetase|uniref:histidine--tRNA ligase n=1 Tax=Maritalea porphyrae TaxID=880732 RepID=UPI0022AF8E17|nr:histidine--tRNA ligase [Maritalea porphyrae]MCZ4271459.1 histidine--tRNA ligase [Maritalea porphyrae]